MRPLVGVLVGIAVVGLAGGAHAADALGPPQPAPVLPPATMPVQPYAPAPPPLYWNGNQWVQPPPPPGLAPFMAPYGYGPGPGGEAFYYESHKKNELLALAIEFFVPGVGSLYADHVAGAMITWALTIGGVILAFWWIGQNAGGEESSFGGSNGPRDMWAIYVALGAIFGGRIYGLVDSYTSASDFNRRLRARLGMPEFAAVSVVPIRTDRAVAWGPSLDFRF